MAKALLRISSCKGPGLSFPAEITTLEKPNTYNMGPKEAEELAIKWCKKFGRIYVSVKADIVYGRDNMDSYGRL